MIPWWRTDFGERDIALVSEAIRNRHISQGPVTRKFEEALAEVIGVPYVCCTTSGTTALTMALRAAGVGRGNEVLVPNRTWIATAHAVMMTGAKVRLVDVGPRGVLDDTDGKTTGPEAASSSRHGASEHLRHIFRSAEEQATLGVGRHWRRLGNLPSDANLPVSPYEGDDAHAYSEHGIQGNTADLSDPAFLRNLNRYAQHHCSTETSAKQVIPVHLNGRFAHVPRGSIEDSCQAFPLSPRGLAACYSFSTAKLLPTGQGGAVATLNEGFYRECLALRTHAIEDAFNPVPVTWSRFGYNFRYTDIQAAIGLAQLETLKERIERLHEIRRFYEIGRPEYLELLPCDGVPLYTEILCANSERLRAYLLDHEIQARPNYPSLHTAPYLRPDHRGSYANYEFPNSRRFESGLTLPSGPAQTDADVKTVIECLHAYQQ